MNGAYVLLCLVLITLGLSPAMGANSDTESRGGDAPLLGALRDLQEIVHQRPSPPPALEVVASLSAYHVLKSQGTHYSAHLEFANAFHTNAGVTDSYVRGRIYFQFMLTDRLDADRDPVIDSLEAGDIRKRKGMAAFWDHQWDRLEQPYTHEWIIVRIMEALKPARPTQGLQFGRQVHDFLKTRGEVLSSLPLTRARDVRVLVEVGEKLSLVMLMQRALLRSHQIILTRRVGVDARPYASFISALEELFPKLTPSARSTIVLFNDIYAEDAHLSARWALADTWYTLNAKLIGSTDAPFPYRNYFGAKAALQRANLSMQQGQLAATEPFLERGLKFAEQVEDKKKRYEMLGFYHRYISQLHTIAGQPVQADENLRKSIDLFTTIDDHNAIGGWAQIAQNLTVQQKPRDALAAVDQGFELASRLLGLYGSEVINEETVGLSLVKAQAHYELREWIQLEIEIARGLALVKRPHFQALFLIYQGLMHEEQGRTKKAMQSFLSALSLRPRDEQSQVTLLINFHIGRLYERQRSPGQTLTYLKRALAIHTAMRKGARQSIAYESILREPTLGKISNGLIQASYELMRAPGENAEMHARQLLYFSELTKARIITDEIEAMRRGTVTYVRPGAARLLTGEIRELLSAFIGLESPVLPMKLDPSTVFDNYQSLIRDLSARHGLPVVLVEYVPITAYDKLLVFIVDAETVTWTELETSWSELGREIERFRKLIEKSLEKYVELSEAPFPDERTANRLRLIETELRSSSTRLGTTLLPREVSGRDTNVLELLRKSSLMVIPHGAMHNIPFAAVKVADEHGDYYLIDVVGRLAAAPSYRTLRLILDLYRPALEREITETLLVGNEKAPDLPHVRQEFQQIRSVFDGTLPTTHYKKGLKQLIQQSSAVHFALHGQVSPEQQLRSRFLLDDEPLELHEILMLEMSRTRLITMAACESAKAEVTTIGDDVWSLATGFLFAGVPAVIGAQWKQEGNSAAEFYELFYRSVRKQGDVGLAYRYAMLGVRDAPGHEPLPGLMGRRNPAYWAGFHLLGE